MQRNAVVWTAAAAALALSSPAAAQTPRVDVEALAEGVYLYTYETHRSLFVVTEDAVLATDPQSVAAAPRYVEEIRKVSSAPIEYLVYSHHHDDHVSGGAAFGDVTIVAHEGVLAHVGGDVLPPDIVFSDEMSIFLGGDLEVRLVYPGPSETESNIIVHVPDRRVAFMVDAVGVRVLPWRNLAGSDPLEWVAALERLDDVDFDVLAPGHGPTGTKAHVAEYIGYMRALIDAVQEGIDGGQSLRQMQDSLELPAYRGWTRYDEHFDLNVEGVYRELTR